MFIFQIDVAGGVSMQKPFADAEYGSKATDRRTVLTDVDYGSNACGRVAVYHRFLGRRNVSPFRRRK